QILQRFPEAKVGYVEIGGLYKCNTRIQFEEFRLFKHRNVHNLVSQVIKSIRKVATGAFHSTHFKARAYYTDFLHYKYLAITCDSYFSSDISSTTRPPAASLVYFPSIFNFDFAPRKYHS